MRIQSYAECVKTDWIFNVKEFGAKGNAKYRNPANG
jgi:hypothetical protein